MSVKFPVRLPDDKYAEVNGEPVEPPKGYEIIPEGALLPKRRLVLASIASLQPMWQVSDASMLEWWKKAKRHSFGLTTVIAYARKK